MKYTNLPCNKNLTPLAKQLRKAGVLSEVLLWNEIKNKKLNGLNFDRQKIIGDYIVDFFCASLGVVIEVDGGSHDCKIEEDKQRDEFLTSLGLKVIRILDKDVKNNLIGIIEFLKQSLKFSSGERSTPERGEVCKHP